MKKIVVEVVKDGLKGYLSGQPSIFAQNAVTTDITKATDYTGKETQLKKDLGVLVLPDDELYAKSGLRVDECFVAEVMVMIDTQTQSRRVGREPHKYNR